jgi:hypothetical protein
VEPNIAALGHLAALAGVPDHEDRLDRLDRADLFVHLLLDRRRLALAPRPVDRDQRLRVRELHPLLDGVRREAPEDDVVGGTDPRAGEHRDRQLGNHRQVDADHVTLADPSGPQRVREPLHVAV